ncbi:MAG: SurA N-terminal domain-containing protein [Candidatus Nomurabacteria bacterium]|jgi:parvulin-like peptidyl-prolyl isomerase|nr:SurA N-terminal domain-containing protein [Candidatus Nomurabacteria bacterium]
MSTIKEKVIAVGEKAADKLPDKLRRSKKEKPAARITNDTVAEHREKILAEGRKFKYPLQYAKHKILINTIIVVIITIIAFGGWLYFMLYQKQATNDFFYSATKILFLPVANVDGQNVPYADYLRRTRSAIFYKERQEKVDFSTSDGQRELDYLKRDEMNKAERAAYAVKIAKAKGITVSNQEIDAEIDKNLKTNSGESMTKNDYEDHVLKQYFGWTMNDYRAELRNQLLERKVAFAVDTAAEAKIKKAEARLKAGEDFVTVVSELSDDEVTRNTGGGVSAQTSDADPNGLVAIARGLGDGAISGIIQGIDGYYIVKLGSKTDDTTKYSMVKVALTQFDNDFSKLREAGKIKEYIKIPELKDIEES